jgi:hypothetical protein
MSLVESLCTFLRNARSDGRLRLRDMMRLRGAHLPHPLSRTAARDAVAAAEHCLACQNKSLCDTQLAARTAEGYELFCPNSDYIERLRRGVLASRRARR